MSIHEKIRALIDQKGWFLYIWDTLNVTKEP